MPGHNNIYYDIRETMNEKPDADTFFVVGQGGVGKSYSIKRFLLLEALEGRKSVYVRRWAEDVKPAYMDLVFNDVIDDPEIQKRLTDLFGELDFIIYTKKECFSLGYIEEETGRVKMLRESIIRITSVSNAERFKGGTYRGYRYIFFDEFISNDGYNGGVHEPEYFSKIIGTVDRMGNPVKVFYAGNPDNQPELCPHLESLKLDYNTMQANTPYVYDRRYYDENGQIRIKGGSIVFLKLANYKGKNYLSGVSSNADNMNAAIRATGERPNLPFPPISDAVKKAFRPSALLTVELPMIVHENDETIYRKRIYIVLGKMPKTSVRAALLIYAHRPAVNVPEIFSRWGENPVLNGHFSAQIYKLQFTNNLTNVKNFITLCIEGKTIYTDEPKTGTWFIDIIREVNA